MKIFAAVLLSAAIPLTASNVVTDWTTIAASLSSISADPAAKEAGVSVGEAAAASLIAARTGDGLEANVPYVPGAGPGAWNPTPPAYLPGLTPWLGQMRPFTMTTAADF